MKTPSSDHCSFCGRRRDARRPLLEGPGDVCICHECVALCTEIMTGAPRQRAKNVAGVEVQHQVHPHRPDIAPEYRCAFCARSRAEVGRLIAGPDAVFICDGCVAGFQAVLA